MNEIKRVHCLYRVSTAGQVEKDDIPMQKQYCRDFVASHDGWRIEREFYEKGVSGFKVSAKERDAIIEIQQDAAAHKFDILLVYMFDRIGRKDDETPFVVEWFVRNGIQVWSAVEGEQRFDNHVDKLLNYIRYWQASGESMKTAIRVKTRMEQLTEGGHYTGGTVPYGYKLVKLGRQNKKNQEVFDLAIDEDQAPVIKLIFEKYAYEGYGAQRLNKYLVENRMFRENGKNFTNMGILRIIKNKLYVGVIHNGNVESEYIPELQIIDEKLFNEAQIIAEGRKTRHSDIPLNMSGKSLLTGNVFCGHCGKHLTLSTSGSRWTTRDGTEHKTPRFRYVCHNRVRHPGECDGQSGYGVWTVDSIIDQVMRYQFSQIEDAAAEDLQIQARAKQMAFAHGRYNTAVKKCNEVQREVEDYRAEAIRVIRGESQFSAGFLDSLIKEKSDQLEICKADAELAKKELDAAASKADLDESELEEIKTWADMYDNCSFEAKKMIVSRFIKSVHIFRDYRVEVEFNISLDQFKRLVSTMPEENEDKAV